MKGKLITLSRDHIELAVWKRPVEYHPTEKICAKKNCSHNGQVQRVSNFTKARHTFDGVSSWCKDCQYGHRREKEEEKKKDKLLNFI